MDNLNFTSNCGLCATPTSLKRGAGIFDLFGKTKGGTCQALSFQESPPFAFASYLVFSISCTDQILACHSPRITAIFPSTTHHVVVLAMFFVWLFYEATQHLRMP
jgi:hypothetical protein